MTKVGQQWRRFRRQHKLTQANLALVLGLSKRAVRYIETGAVTPRRSTQELFLALVQRYKEAYRLHGKKGRW